MKWMCTVHEANHMLLSAPDLRFGICNIAFPIHCISDSWRLSSRPRCDFRSLLFFPKIACTIVSDVYEVCCREHTVFQYGVRVCAYFEASYTFLYHIQYNYNANLGLLNLRLINPQLSQNLRHNTKLIYNQIFPQKNPQNADVTKPPQINQPPGWGLCFLSN